MPTDELNDRDCRVIFGMCSGLSMEEIAKYLELPQGVVQNAATNIYDRLEVSTRPELILWAMAALNGELQRRNSQK